MESFLKHQGVITTDFQLEFIQERFDKNKDGRITMDEVYTYIKSTFSFVMNLCQ
jgi:hypothetical protein